MTSTGNLPKHISYSSFNTWLECGWKYYLTKMYEVPEKHAVWFTGGTAVHKATELFDRGKFGDSNNLDELWNEVWFEQIKQDEEIYGDMNSWEFRGREGLTADALADGCDEGRGKLRKVSGSCTRIIVTGKQIGRAHV